MADADRDASDDEELAPDVAAREASEMLERGDGPALNALVEDLHQADVAELLTRLDPEERIDFVRTLGNNFDFTSLTEVDEPVRIQILSELAPKEVAQGLAELDSDDAVYILEDLDDAEAEAILAELPFAMRHRLKQALDFPDDSAGRRMQSDFVAMPPFWTVGQVVDALRDSEDLPEAFTQIFVVDPAFRLLGTVALDRLLRSGRSVKISEIMEEDPWTIDADEDQEEAARLFQRYDLLSAAVVDDGGRLVGILTIDDIVDVIQSEAEEDIRRLAGAGDAELSDTWLYVARTRVPWLLVNTITVFASAAVIALFDATIEAMVALAVLMPVVSALGGNAGVQAMTVTVRALSQRQITRGNVFRVILREVLVGLLNGLAVAAAVGVIAWLAFGNWQLGGVIAAALVFNVVVAGFLGAVLPMLLDRFGADPAVATSVFLTALTDVIGFLAFLSLAAWWFGLGS